MTLAGIGSWQEELQGGQKMGAAGAGERVFSGGRAFELIPFP